MKKLIYVFALIGIGTITYWIGVSFIKTIQYVLLCDESVVFSACTEAKAQFSYDTGDGQFVIHKLTLPSGEVKNFSGTECWVNSTGSQCMDSSTNENKTEFSQIIVPLAARGFGK